MAWTDLTAYAAGRFTVAMAELLRGNFKAIGDAWTTYTPTWTATTTNPTLGNGTISGRYISAGKLAIISVSTVFGSTTTVGSGSYAWSTPGSISARDFHVIQGSAMLLDSSAGSLLPKVAWAVNGTSIVVSDLTPTRISHNSPVIWATGDRIDFQVIFEAS